MRGMRISQSASMRITQGLIAGLLGVAQPVALTAADLNRREGGRLNGLDFRAIYRLV
jgi:hypothetical protein